VAKDAHRDRSSTSQLRARDWRVRLLLVAPSTSYRVEAFLDAAAALACAVTAASDAPSAIPGSSICVPFDDPASAAALLVAQVGAVDGVVGTDGDAVTVASEVAARLGLPTNHRAAVAAAADKLAQRTAAARAGVPQPDFARVDESAASWSIFPAVVKPVGRCASQGVLRADRPSELDDTLQRVRQIVGDNASLILEQFVPGVEVAVEGLLRNGELEVLAVFDKPDTPQGPTFPETILVSPARLEPDALGHVVDVAARACSAVGLVEGPVHVECKVGDNDVQFLELAARSIGGLCSRSLKHVGVSLEELILRHALGLPVSQPQARTRGATGVLMLPVARTGRLLAVRGANAARAAPGVTDVVLSVGPGQHVVALPEGDRYLGFVFASAETPDRVETALRTAWRSLEIDISAS
jgi:biotin carboxylase